MEAAITPVGLPLIIAVGLPLIILIVIFGFRHPPPQDDFTPLDDSRRAIGLIMLVFFVVSFTPLPFRF